MWDGYAGRLLLGGPLRSVVNLDALVEAGVPGRRSFQLNCSRGMGTLDVELQVTANEMAVAQLPPGKNGDDSKTDVEQQCAQCAKTHGYSSYQPCSYEGRIDHPFRIFLVLWLIRRRRQFSRMVEPSTDDYTLHEVLHAASRAKILIPPVSVHFTQLVVFMAALLRLGHMETHMLLSTLEHACFDCDLDSLRFPQERHWTHHLPTVFSVLVRGAPCPSLRWCFSDSLNFWCFEGASFLFVALARLRHAMSQYAIDEAWPRWSCSFELRPLCGVGVKRQGGADTDCRVLRAAFGVVVLLSCYSMGCLAYDTSRLPVPGIDIGRVSGGRTLQSEMIEVSGTLAALLRHEMFMHRLSLDGLLSAISTTPVFQGRFSENPIAFLSSAIGPLDPDDALTRGSLAPAPLSVMITLAAESRTDEELAQWVDPLDAFTGKLTHGTASNSIVPALRAGGHGGAGVIDFTGLPFYPDSAGLFSDLNPMQPLGTQLRISPTVFSRLSLAPIMTLQNRRSAWALDAYHCKILQTLLLCLGQRCGAAGLPSLPRLAIISIFRALNIRDLGGRMTQEHYVCGLLRAADAHVQSRAVLRTASFNLVYTHHPT